MTAKKLISDETKRLLPFAPDSENIVKLIFEEVTGRDAFLERISGGEVSESETAKITEMVSKCMNGEPVQYVTGKQYFMGNEFAVTPDVLIPRADTEILAEAVIKYSKGKRLNILDLCTGSGCIGISAAKAVPEATVCCSDISEAAIEVAKSNIIRNKTEKNTVTLVSDMFEKCGVYDVIASNPPYIPKKVISTLEKRVKDHEPHSALDGGNDGLDFYRQIALEAGGHLSENGRLFLEIGYDQKESVTKLLDKAGFSDIVCLKDYSGNDRVIICRK